MWRSAGLGFGAAVAFWPGWTSAAITPRWALIAVGSPLVAWLDPRRVEPLVLAALVLVLIYATLSLAYTPDPLTGIGGMIHLLILASAFLMGASLSTVEPLLLGVAWGLSVSAILAVIQVASGWSPVDQAIAPAGLFFNRLILGETIAPLLAWAVVSQRITLSVILGVGLVASQSRVGIVAAIVGVSVVNWRRAWPLPFVAAILATLAYLFGWTPFTADRLASFGQRLEIWSDAIRGLTLWGDGIGAFQTRFPRWEFAHSDFLQAGYELGVVGLTFVSGAIILGWRRSTRNPLRAAIAALGIVGLFSFSLQLPMLAFVACVLAGHLSRVGAPLRGLPSLGRGDHGAYV
jgi:hypothetical protein